MFSLITLGCGFSWIGVAAGINLFLFPCVGCGETQKIMLYGLVDPRMRNEREHARSRRGRDKGNGLRFLILLCMITLCFWLLLDH